MNTETITLTIGSETFFEAIVDFEYEPEEKATECSPPAPEQVIIYRAQLPIDIGEGEIWVDLNKDHFHLIKNQVIEFIEEQREDRKLERAIDELERKSRELD